MLDAKGDLLTGGLIELPLRGTFDAFLTRRRETYAPYSDDHADLYQDEIAAFVLKYAVAFKDRRGQSADSLIDLWSSGPDNSPLWRPIEKLGLRAARRIAKIPELIHRSEAGIVWQGIQDRLTAADKVVEYDLQRILQSDFVESYCDEYGTDTLRELQYGWRDLRRTAGRGGYLSYRNFRSSLDPLGVREMVEMMAAESMMGIRTCRGYIEFLDKYRVLARDDGALRRIAADYGKRYRSKAKAIAVAVKGRSRPGTDWALTGGELNEMDDILASIAASMPGPQNMAPHSSIAGVEEIRMRQKRIAIFVALDEERMVFERSGLKLSKDQHPDHLVGEKDGVRIEVYCAHAMGRVNAAVATMEYLSLAEVSPDLLIVTGLAGGFEAAKVSEGAVMIPEQVFDLALRKIKDGESPEFRLEGYRTDRRLKEYLESNGFDRNGWATAAHIAAEWPEDRRPSIRHDPLTSVDEVVSSIEHADQLRTAFPKLAGVEMEAGGVFAAARKFDVDVAVIRAVSDKADPAKADNEWRRRAMKTIISLIEFIDLAKMLER